MTSHDGKEAIVVESSKLGTIISGNHQQHVLHGNLGTTSGGRIIFSFYLAQALLNRAPNRFVEQPSCPIHSHESAAYQGSEQDKQTMSSVFQAVADVGQPLKACA